MLGRALWVDKNLSYMGSWGVDKIVFSFHPKIVPNFFKYTFLQVFFTQYFFACLVFYSNSGHNYEFLQNYAGGLKKLFRPDHVQSVMSMSYNPQGRRRRTKRMDGEEGDRREEESRRSPEKGGREEESVGASGRRSASISRSRVVFLVPGPDGIIGSRREKVLGRGGAGRSSQLAGESEKKATAHEPSFRRGHDLLQGNRVTCFAYVRKGIVSHALVQLRRGY